MGRILLLDDHSLIDEILNRSISEEEPDASLFTTSYWYYRACRGAVLGAGGQLSGPFEKLGTGLQKKAIRSLLGLPDQIAIPGARLVVPAMVRVAEQHSKLNLLNLEAVAVASLTSAHVLLSERAAAGLLPAVLEVEQISWSSPPTRGVIE